MYGFKKDTDASLGDINIINSNDGPTDTISSISWAPNINFRIFAASGWDSKIRLYETIAQQGQKGLVLKTTLDVEDPCLCTSWTGDMSKLFAGSVNNTIKGFDLTTGQAGTIGQHDGAVRDVYWLDEANVLCSLSFDAKMKFWDLRQSNAAATFNLGHKVFCSDMKYPNIAMGVNGEKILVIHIPNALQTFSKQLEYIESPLGNNSQLTAMSFFADGSGLGIAANDGRANLSGFSVDKSDRIKLDNIMTFKCHKSDTSITSQSLYPVHGIGFHPNAKNFLYTAGGEGSLFFWDYSAKNKISSFHYDGVPINKTKMSPDGALLAYSLGYDWAKGIEGYMSYKPKICVHMMQESELVYKSSK